MLIFVCSMALIEAPPQSRGLGRDLVHTYLINPYMLVLAPAYVHIVSGDKALTS